MSLLAGVNTAENLEKEVDKLGGFQLLDSGVHLMKVETAYLHTATSGAKAIVMSFKNDTGSLRSTQYYASGNAKNNQTFYVKDGKQYSLPGFTVVNDIFKVSGFTNGMADAVLEEKVIKLYSKDANGEVPTRVQMITNLLNKEIALGVLKQTEDKSALGTDGKYHATGETRDVNEINKVFSTDGLTVPEIDAGIKDPAFIVDWKTKYDGVVINKATSAGTSASTGAAKPVGKKMFK